MNSKYSFRSIPYFENDLKSFMIDNISDDMAFVIDKDWRSMFHGFASSWAHSPEWLGRNVFGYDEDLKEKILAKGAKLRLPNYFDSSKYLDADLNATLQACKRFNLITKEEWKEFEKYRDTFRNGYSHANPKQILGESKGGFMLGSFSGGKESEFRELTYSKVSFLQGLSIEGFSQANALPYFIAVENLIRKTMKYIQADEDKKDYELVRIVNGQI